MMLNGARRLMLTANGHANALNRLSCISHMAYSTKGGVATKSKPSTFISFLLSFNTHLTLLI